LSSRPAIAGSPAHHGGNWKRKLSPRGGRYFFHRVELAVPSFRQADEEWRDDPLGGVEANGTLGGEGCVVAAVTMANLLWRGGGNQFLEARILAQ
jgi:hypothetical protein